uniref:Reverse transcriptase domain-containing protein n=1 Tax=Cajanus cajan TaxID=3821 RepID=A0A151SVY0_CAJCA|nr:hypothetical protein KK1_014369 [Cajanus cajan]
MEVSATNLSGGILCIWSERREFNQFVLDMKLDDLPMLGKPFRLMDYWLVDKEIGKVIEDRWKKNQLQGIGIGGLCENELMEMRKLQERFWKLLTKNKYIVHYKSRVKWLLERDGNSRYYHTIVNWKREKNMLRGLPIKGEWCEEPNKVKEEVHNFFSRHFKKKKFIVLLEEFHTNGKFSKGKNMTFIALIPKGYDPKGLGDYRLISLVFIDQRQSVFLCGRQLLYSVTIVNEVVEEAKRMKNKCIIFKVDYEKAYDSINWEFLFYM